MKLRSNNHDNQSSDVGESQQPKGPRLDIQASQGNQFVQEQMRAAQRQQASLFFFTEPMVMPRPMIGPYLEPFVRPLVEPMTKPALDPLPMVDPLPPIVTPIDGINPDVKVDPKPEPQTEDGGSDSVEQEDETVQDSPDTEQPKIEGPTEIEPGQNDNRDRPKSTDGDQEPHIPTPKPNGPAPDHYLSPEQLPPKAPPGPPFKVPRIFQDL